jgi:hypothetical protein
MTKKLITKISLVLLVIITLLTILPSHVFADASSKNSKNTFYIRSVEVTVTTCGKQATIDFWSRKKPWSCSKGDIYIGTISVARTSLGFQVCAGGYNKLCSGLGAKDAVKKALDEILKYRMQVLIASIGTAGVISIESLLWPIILAL